MNWRTAVIGRLVWAVIIPVLATTSFSGLGSSSPDSWHAGDAFLSGQASFSGQVISATCSLAMEDRFQSIDMGTTPIRDLQGTSQGTEKDFYLRLVNCDLGSRGGKFFTGYNIRLTFDGLRGKEPEGFYLSGKERGVSLQIRDSQGNFAVPGKVMPPQVLKGNDPGLKYHLRLVRNGEPLQSGDYYAVLRFKIDYE